MAGNSAKEIGISPHITPKGLSIVINPCTVDTDRAAQLDSVPAHSEMQCILEPSLRSKIPDPSPAQSSFPCNSFRRSDGCSNCLIRSTLFPYCPHCAPSLPLHRIIARSYAPSFERQRAARYSRPSTFLLGVDIAAERGFKQLQCRTGSAPSFMSFTAL